MTFHGERISRRTVLRGIGGTVLGLPFLEAMLSQAHAAGDGQAGGAATHGVSLRAHWRSHGQWTPAPKAPTMN